MPALVLVRRLPLRFKLYVLTFFLIYTYGVAMIYFKLGAEKSGDTPGVQPHRQGIIKTELLELNNVVPEKKRNAKFRPILLGERPNPHPDGAMERLHLIFPGRDDGRQDEHNQSGVPNINHNGINPRRDQNERNHQPQIIPELNKTENQELDNFALRRKRNPKLQPLLLLDRMKPDSNRFDGTFGEAFRSRRFDAYQASEANRSGPGEHGLGIDVSKEEAELSKRQVKTDGFHVFISDRMALDRSLDDYRDPRCLDVVYPDNLPIASVIVIFCNEAFSVLVRTIHGVVNRTPPKYLKEVILVDDASDREELKGYLTNYTEVTWPDNIVRFVRLTNRSGLMRARIAGAKAASGDAIVILDGHVEVTRGWIEPLLARIQENRKALVIPALDNIDPRTFQYLPLNQWAYIDFRWDLNYQWRNVPEPLRGHPRYPIRSQAMVGCAMAMDREMFFEMGSFDPDMAIWGGENTEIGFRMWMCGGSLENLPCSRVAHLFRLGRPWKTNSTNYYLYNTQRTAEVWLDDYKKYYYNIFPQAKTSDYGDISERRALRQRLKCHDFQWFLDNVADHKFLYDVNVTAWGKIPSADMRVVMINTSYDMENPAQHIRSPDTYSHSWDNRIQLRNLENNYCLDNMGNNEQGDYSMGLYPFQETSANQLFSLTWSGELRREFHCATYTGSSPGDAIPMMSNCPQSLQQGQRWIYKPRSHEMIHLPSKFCLDTRGARSASVATLNECNGNYSQQWEWSHLVEQPLG